MTTMPDTELSAKTNKELLLLLNYRLKMVEEKLKDLCSSVNNKTNIADTKDLEERVNTLWDWRNKVIGFSIAAGAVSGTIGGVLANILTKFGGL